MTPFKLHQLVKKGELRSVQELLGATGEAGPEVNGYDGAGYTPLMHAVMSPRASVELVRLLLGHGAEVNQQTLVTGEDTTVSVMAVALGGGDPEKVSLLLYHGADIHYEREGGYDALIDAVHGRDVLRDDRLIDLLKLLICSGVELNGMSSYRESGCRVLSRIGRFDAVRLLLDAGADAQQLQWTPLMHAVAAGSLTEIQHELALGAALEEKDSWERTPWLLAIQTGDIDKARLLLERGSNRNARGRCGKPPLFFAIETYQTSMLRWLLEIGMRVEERDNFGTTPLITAVEHCNLEAVNELLEAGADVDAKHHDETAMHSARTREIALRLLTAGAAPSHLALEGMRALLGFEPDPDETLLDISPAEFRKDRTRRFGAFNPEKFDSSYYEMMIRAGITAYDAAELFKDQVEPVRVPVWCAHRFGQSITFLGDGRVIQIGGEHEDYYDPDFCIYNDVFVHQADGKIGVYGYPEAVFPPTDFHTATVVGEEIYIIGSLGYGEARRYGKTLVYRLNTTSLEIELVSTGGDEPGWIYRHTAVPLSDHQIRVFGGTVVTWSGEKEVHTKNDRSFTLDLEQRIWVVA